MSDRRASVNPAFTGDVTNRQKGLIDFPISLAAFFFLKFTNNCRLKQICNRFRIRCKNILEVIHIKRLSYVDINSIAQIAKSMKLFCLV